MLVFNHCELKINPLLSLNRIFYSHNIIKIVNANFKLNVKYSKVEVHKSD